MRRAGAAIAVAAMLAPFLSAAVGCTRSSEVATDAAAPVIDAAPVIPAARVIDAAASASATIARPPPAPCRAIAASGKILASHETDGGTPAIATGDVVDSWIDLDTGARATVKEPRTGRELLFVGPGSAFPCVGESEAWLIHGEFMSARGSGEKPGAEQWVVTPSAVVRYGAAVLDVRVNADGTRALLKAGGGSMLAEGGDSWHPLDPSAPLVAPRVFAGTGPGTDDADAAADRCAEKSAAAKTLEDQLLAPGETRDPSFGDLAKRTTEARILARAVCAMRTLRAAMRSAPPP